MNDENIFEGIFDDLYQPSPEDEHHFWNGEGFITFYVVQNIIKDDIFEIEVEDYDGCAGGAHETVGFDYLIKEMLGINIADLKEGHTYTIEKLTVVWTRGDGWTIDDDVDYYFENLKDEIQWFRFLKQKLTNLWWQNFGWRIADARRKR